MLWTLLLLAGMGVPVAPPEPDPHVHSSRPAPVSHALPRGRDLEPLLAIDTLFSIENRGILRVFVTLNEHRFKLVTDPSEVDRSDNAFLIPIDGRITINIARLLEPDDEDPFDDDCTAPVRNGNNCIEIRTQGPDTASASVLISDTPIAGQSIAYAVTPSDLKALPARVTLAQNYPNPFGAQTTITYTVPRERTNGVPVTLAVYDVLGRQIAVLAEERFYPGTFQVTWPPDGGSPLPSGVYIAVLRTDEASAHIRMTRVR